MLTYQNRTIARTVAAVFTSFLATHTPVHAQAQPPETPAAADAPLTAETAVEQYKEMYAGFRHAFETRDSDSIRQYMIEILNWDLKVRDAELDLAEHSYILAYPRYFNHATQDSADDVLIQYFTQYESFPEDPMMDTGLLDRLMPRVVEHAVKSESPTLARRAAHASADVYEPSYIAYTMLMGPLLQDTRPAAKSAMFAIAGDALENDNIPNEDKWSLVRMLHGAYGVAHPEEQSDGDEPHHAVPFVDFTGPMLDGGQFNLDDYKGKVVLIDFWATWCGPCITEMPHLVKLNDDFKDQGLQIIGVSLDNSDQEDKLHATTDKHNMTWSQVYAGGGWQTQPAILNNVRSIPHTILIDRQGRARAAGLRGDALDAKVKELLKEEAQ